MINKQQKEASEARGQPGLLLILTSRGWSHVISIFGSESWCFCLLFPPTSQYWRDIIKDIQNCLNKCSINWHRSDQPPCEGMLFCTVDWQGEIDEENKRIAVRPLLTDLQGSIPLSFLALVQESGQESYCFDHRCLFIIKTLSLQQKMTHWWPLLLNRPTIVCTLLL